VTNPDGIVASNAASSNRWKIILIVLWILVGIFVILVIIFAVRAKMNQQEEGSETSPESSSNG
jgi:heme/copper-type cytochrome/quinol oxidase subunit 2